jgi:hypothetical protein
MIVGKIGADFVNCVNNLGRWVLIGLGARDRCQ